NKDGIYPCKDPTLVSVDDFSFSRLQTPPTTTNERDSVFTQVYDHQIPGLNTLGISSGLFDFAKGGYVPPHFHPETTEILTVIKGSILINFNTSAPENSQFSKLIRDGDVFVIPKGHHHMLKNVGQTDAAVISAFSNQSPELVYVS
nr:germin-like protein [Tanacetum cinerariifolium]